MTPEQIAEAILTAAGSSLRHYTTRTRDDILNAAQEIKDKLEAGA